MSKLLQFINQLHRDAVHDAAIMCRKKEKSSNCFNTNEKGVPKRDKAAQILLQLVTYQQQTCWRFVIRSSKWKLTKKKLQRPVRPDGAHRRCWATTKGKTTQGLVEGMKMEKRERKEWKPERTEVCFYSLSQPSSSVEDGWVGAAISARLSSPSRPSCCPSSLRPRATCDLGGNSSSVR